MTGAAEKANIDHLVQQWLDQDPFDETRREIISLQEGGHYDELVHRLGKRIAFGTAGLRSKMAAGFACMNPLIVVQTTQGLLQYIVQHHSHKKNGDEKETSAQQAGVVIGYDGRHNSERFAQLTASVFVARGFRVYLFGNTVPTPLVPFGVRLLGAVAGIMITASHNPKQDNGYKLYWDNGCQIIEPHDANISQAILQNLKVWDDVDLTCQVLQQSPLVHDPTQQVVEQYYSQMRDLCFTRDTNSGTALRIAYTAMHGVGAPWVARAFREFGLPEYVPVAQQVDPDPDFPTVAFPNPEEGAGSLKLAMETAESSGARIILANDPDADRLAVAERLPGSGEWRIYNGNEIALLLAHWTWTNFRAQSPDVPASKCVMINSTVSSKVLRAMAQREGFIFEETLTGFKWIGNKADEYVRRKDEGYRFLFGYEVEIGFAVGDMSLDKDGVRTAAVFYEMAHNVLRDHESLAAFLETLYARYGHYLMNTHYFFTPTTGHVKSTLDKIRNMDPDGKNHGYPVRIGEYDVVNVRDLAVGFELQAPNHKPTMPVNPSNQMITFTFGDGSTCTLRNSGTEPKLKWYVEVSSMESKVAAAKKLEELTALVINELLRPEENGLIAP